MTPIGWLGIIVCILMGAGLGYYLSKKFPNLLGRFGRDGKMEKVLNDPHLLIEKLKSHGKIYEDRGDGRRVEIEIKLGEDSKTGKEVVVIEEKESRKGDGKAKKIQKKIEKNKEKVKKKGKKK